jgi:hypothetical protein
MGKVIVHESTKEDNELWAVIEEGDTVHIRPVIDNNVVDTPIEREENVTDEVVDLGVEPEEGDE